MRKRRSSADDQTLSALHDEVFSQTNCLQCANCCKSYPPLLKAPDIRRIAKHTGLSEAEFMSRYLVLDEDDDWVMHSTPCPFLQADNLCAIYAVRPAACREYPHTNRKKLYQIKDITMQNAEICPAVAPILERMAQNLKTG